MAWCEDNGVDYIFVLSGNRALLRLAYDVAPDLHPARGAQPGADDDLVARRPHLLDRLQGRGNELRLAAALRGRLVRAVADVAVRERLELLDDLAVVGKALAEQMGEECRRVARD